MRNQLVELRKVMTEYGIDVYIIPSTDYHNSEYVNNYFKCREYISGFNGSAGTLLVTTKEAKLWTDGRYFLQANHQLKGSGIDLMKINTHGYPTINEYLRDHIANRSCIGFDGRLFPYEYVENIFTFLKEKEFKYISDIDLVDLIWLNRPKIHPSLIYSPKMEYVGVTSDEKIREVRESLSFNNATLHITNALDEIAWLFNLRGDDVDYTPVFFSYAIISIEDCRLYVKDTTTVKNIINSNNVTVLPYEQIYSDVSNISSKERILIDKSILSYSLVKALPKDALIYNASNCISSMKAYKNAIEIKATKKAHLYDGIAMVKFIYWLKNNINSKYITEISASDFLLMCRKEQPGFIQPSFETICGYNIHGAIVHYAATNESNIEIKPEGLLLVDSGGQYEFGTTDITRTIVMGPITDKMKEYYTAVLKGHIQLAIASVTPGIYGADLDRIARSPLLEKGLNYNHGTGHGVGHMLSVHEGPNVFSPRGEFTEIEPGMVTTDEPGVYIENEFGIRLENELLCINSNGYFAFEPLTLCPFDLKAINVQDLTEVEIQYLNNYHNKVYDNLAPLLNEPERKWLKESTREI